MSKTLEIMPGIFWAGVVDFDLRVFDIIMETKYGTNYNSYVVKGSEKIALIDTVKENFCEEYFEKLGQIIDISKIDYIVINHTEPDHTGCLKSVLDAAPNATVICTSPAKKNLQDIMNMEFECIIPKPDTIIDLGGKTLQFINAPFLHWPDTMFTYVPEDKALFTCDAFGCHYATDKVLESIESDEFLKAQKYYYDVIISPYAKYVLEAIDKIEKNSIEIKTLFPSHGPVLDKAPLATIERYRKWAAEDIEHKKANKAVVAYVSSYGYTKMLAEQITKALKDKGMDTTFLDISSVSAEEAASIITSASAVAIGSPTINKDALHPVWNVLSLLSAIAVKGTNAVAFGSYGWSGEAVPMIEERLKGLGYNVVDTLRVKFRPIQGDLKMAYELGEKLAELTINK